MTEPLIQVKDLTIGFASAEGVLAAVKGIDFVLYRGQTFALLGESGCGKSLTALALMQLLPPAAWIMGQGHVLLDGQDLLSLPEAQMRHYRGCRIAMIFQEPMTSLNPVFTIGDQIGEVLRVHQGLRGRHKQQRIIELLEQVHIPDPEQRCKEYPHQLSGGMKQRVMIAIALAGDPEVLIADEPTTALDVTIQAGILDLLKEIQQRTGMAILLITHDLGVVAEMADQVGVMYAGHLVEQGDCRSFFAKPLHPYSQKLFAALPSLEKRSEQLSLIPGLVPPLTDAIQGCRFASRCEHTQRVCRQQAPRYLQIEKAHLVRCHLYDKQIATHIQPRASVADPRQQAAKQQESAELLRVQNLKIHFPIQKGLLKRTVATVKAVDDVSLSLRQGRTLALVGESGCGKTTVGKGILQLLKPTHGQVYYQETDLTGMPRRRLRALRSALQIIFQDPFSSMDPRMLVRDIIAEGLQAQGIEKRVQEERIDAMMAKVGLAEASKTRYPHEFSGGQRQRICIARALVVQPKVIICDEPTSALDVSVQAQILNLLKQLQNDLALAYLFITHNISVVAYLADEVAVMYLGRIVERGRVEDILQTPKHPYTQALLAAVPKVDPKTGRSKLQLGGELPSPSNPPSGCYFHPRCPHVMDTCRKTYPGQTQLTSEHSVHCFLVGETERSQTS